MACYSDGLVCNVEAWRFGAAAALLLLGAFLVRCGVDVCWSRVLRRRGKPASRPPVQW
ncbi:MAG: hypothetical protein HY926_10925 [Elusimicrobia bacterium]|nr:hypothetical protein [Elusimicrobiota bacterium]